MFTGAYIQNHSVSSPARLFQLAASALIFIGVCSYAPIHVDHTEAAISLAAGLAPVLPDSSAPKPVVAELHHNAVKPVAIVAAAPVETATVVPTAISTSIDAGPSLRAKLAETFAQALTMISHLVAAPSHEPKSVVAATAPAPELSADYVVLPPKPTHSEILAEIPVRTPGAGKMNNKAELKARSSQYVALPPKPKHSEAFVETAAIVPAMAPLPPSKPVAAENVQVLSSADAELYRDAFLAQENGDWSKADHDLTQTHSKLLVGHVLADRYSRRPTNVAELRDWLSKYADLPEANTIYAQVRGENVTQSNTPNVADNWGGGRDSLDVSPGFRAEVAGAGRPSSAQIRFDGKINDYIHRGRIEQAEAQLKTDPIKLHLSDSAIAAERAHVAAGYFFNGQFDDARRIARLAADGNSPLGLWINGLSAWRQKDIQGATQSFARLAAMPDLTAYEHTAAAFWAYRTCKASGNGAQANYWLRQASTQTNSFYGVLAANLLAHNIVWSWETPKLTDAGLSAIVSQNSGRRALALLQIDQSTLAEAELRHLNPQGRHEVQEAMLALAEKNHMAGLSMQVGRMASNDNGGRLYAAAMYPVPSWQPEQGFQIDRALMYALIRHESGFNPAAVSPAGACGLMQLMPSTARLMANDDSKPGRKCPAKLMQPGYNMSLGQKYVKALADQAAIGDNLVLLLTAYNSGPGKVADWYNNAPNDPLFFVESLPMHETRGYVEQVLMHYWSYRARLNLPETSLAQLARGEWPHYALHDEKPVKVQSVQTTVGFEVASK